MRRLPRLPGQRMQDVDGVTDVQALSEPPRSRGPRVRAKSFRGVPRSKDLHGIAGNVERRWHLGHEPAVRATEPKLAIGLSIELVALFVNRAVMPTTEQGEVRERGGAAVGPVTDVVALAKAGAAAREATAMVAMVQRSS